MDEQTGAAARPEPEAEPEPETEAETEDRLRHGSSFGAAAAAYAEHRPGYAEAAVRWALEPVLDHQPARAADVGAGTGKRLVEAGDFLRRQPKTAHGEFTLPMVTVVLRARRR